MSAETQEQVPQDSRRTHGSPLYEFLAKNFNIISIVGVFLILFAFFSIQADAFFTAENLVNVGRQISPTIIVAVMMTLVITTGQIDLSVGSIVGLSSSALALMIATGNPLLGLIGTIAIAGFAGLVNGVLAAYGRLPAFIVTLASLIALRGVALLITQGYSTPITVDWILWLGQGKILGIFVPFWIALITVAGGWFLFTQTRFGRYVTAVGSNSEALRRSGVNIKKIQMSVLILSATFAGIASVLIAGRLASGSSNSGTLFELEVITAVVLGGTNLLGGRGSVMGTFVGALTLGIIANGLVLLRVDVFWVPITQGLILIIAMLLNQNAIDSFTRRKV
ncbi:MAG: ABC transporter permease [Candidatus Nanopelagicales bacterium]|nr:ABC transporter permease [Candidatus Nanopelagicales bacterium]